MLKNLGSVGQRATMAKIKTTLHCNLTENLVRGPPYMTSDGRGEGGSAKSDVISKAVLIKHLMREEGGGGQKMAKII